MHGMQLPPFATLQRNNRMFRRRLPFLASSGAPNGAQSRPSRCPPGALCVEVTLYGSERPKEADEACAMDDECRCRVEWRSNREVPQLHGNLSWLSFPLPLSGQSVLDPPWTTLSGSQKLFSELQYVRLVHIPDEEMDRLVALMRLAVPRALAAVAMDFGSSPDIDCWAGADLRAEFFGGEGASALRCAEVCVQDEACGGFTWIDQESGLFSCYTKRCARSDVPPRGDTPGCWRSANRIWFSRRMHRS